MGCSLVSRRTAAAGAHKSATCPAGRFCSKLGMRCALVVLCPRTARPAGMCRARGQRSSLQKSSAATRSRGAKWEQGRHERRGDSSHRAPHAARAVSSRRITASTQWLLRLRQKRRGLDSLCASSPRRLTEAVEVARRCLGSWSQDASALQHLQAAAGSVTLRSSARFAGAAARARSRPRASSLPGPTHRARQEPACSPCVQQRQARCGRRRPESPLDEAARRSSLLKQPVPGTTTPWVQPTAAPLALVLLRRLMSPSLLCDVVALLWCVLLHLGLLPSFHARARSSFRARALREAPRAFQGPQAVAP
jgi:hypothetical protein